MKRTKMRKSGVIASCVAMIASLLTVLAVSSPAAGATYPYPAPTGFKVTKTGSTLLFVAWSSPSSAIKSWAVQASTSSSFPDGKKTVIVNNATTTQIAGLQPSTTYYLRVRGRSTTNDLTPWSTVISKRTSSYAFSPPSTPSVSRIRKDSFKLNWGEVPNASAYRIQLSTRSSFSGDGAPGGTGGAPIYLLNGRDNAAYVGRGGTVTVEATGANTETLIRPNTTYYVRVRALEAKPDEEGAVRNLTNYSGTRSLKTSETWTSYPPENFKFVSSSKDEIVLSWSGVETQVQPGVATHYRIQHWKSSTDKRYLDTDDFPVGAGSITQSGGTYTLRLKKFCNSATDVCSAFTPGSAYYFRVQAQHTNVAISDYTDPAGVKAIATSASLPFPADFRVDRVTDNAMTLSWLPVAGATSYRLQQKSGSTSGTTRYLYDLCRTTGASLPTPTCSTAGGRISVTLNKFQDNYTGASTTMGPNQSYYLRVVAQRSPNETDRPFEGRASDYNSSYTNAKLRGWPFDAPSSFVMQAQDGHSITMKWDAAPTSLGPVRYRIQYATNSAMSGASYKTSGIDATSLKFTGLASERTYYFRIRVVNATDTVTLSDYTSQLTPSTARTTNPRGTVAGSLTVPASCDVDDYRLVAYWGDEVVDDVPPTAGTNNFRIPLLREGAAYDFQYAYVGQGNCVSPWASSAADPNAESHMLKSKATGYPISENQTTQLGTTTALAGAKVTGIVRNSSGTALDGVFVTAYGAPASSTDSYREVHALIATDANGRYALDGLWPGKKYKFRFQTLSSLGSAYKVHEFWVNNTQPADYPVKLCGTTQTGCVSSPEIN